MTTKLFSELGLSPEILKAIDKLGFEQAAPIQAEAIPVLMEGKDVVGQSQTGSGKTAAFAIPAIEKTNPDERVVQVLILCPTRELAVQVSEEVHKLALFKKGIHALPIYGGQSYERQFYGLKQGAQIVIGTPGRVMDHMRRGTLNLARVKMVILDEADTMLDMGFREDIEFILQAVPKERQTVFFSATMPKAIRDLIEKYARQPQAIRLEQKTMTVPTVEQVYYEVDRRFKVELLIRLIDIHDLKLGIVFCNTKRMVDDLVDHLNAQGYSADRLHGDMNQGMRDRVMNKFRRSGLEFLVATDVAARGIDVDDVQVVFNYDLPYDAEDYVHRIGRTGRAGRSGRAISFASGREVFQIRNIERFINMRIPRAPVPTRDEVEEARSDVFLEKLRTTLRGGNYKKQDHLIERLLEEGFVSTDIASALWHHLQGGQNSPTAGVVQDDRPPRNEERPRPSTAPRDKPWQERRSPGASDDSRSREHDRPSRPAGRSRDDFRGREMRPPPTGVARPRSVSVSRPSAAPATVSRVTRPAVNEPESTKAAEVPRRSTEAQTPRAPKVHPPRQPDARPPVVARRESTKPSPEAKASRRTPTDQVRLHVSVGEEMGVVPSDVVGAIMGETGLPPKTVGTIDVRERHSFVDVSSEHAHAIVAKLNRARLKGHKLKVKLA